MLIKTFLCLHSSELPAGQHCSRESSRKARFRIKEIRTEQYVLVCTRSYQFGTARNCPGTALYFSGTTLYCFVLSCTCQVPLLVPPCTYLVPLGTTLYRLVPLRYHLVLPCTALYCPVLDGTRQYRHERNGMK